MLHYYLYCKRNERNLFRRACIDKVNTIMYNANMERYKYRIFKIKGQKFVVKMDLNPITNEFDYHMYIRHLVTPQQAIAAFYSKTREFYNRKYDRYELYSESTDITVYYTYLKEQDVFLITAFYQGDNNGQKN